MLLIDVRLGIKSILAIDTCTATTTMSLRTVNIPNAKGSKTQLRREVQGVADQLATNLQLQYTLPRGSDFSEEQERALQLQVSIHL